MAAVREVTAREVPLLVVLMALRTLPAVLLGRRRVPAGPLLDSLHKGGFVTLRDDPDQLVLGVIGRFWRPTGDVRPIRAAEFTGFAEPGLAKAAVDFRVEPEGARTRVTTETRIAGTDDHARRTFVRYWRVIHLGSAAIRVAWLRAIRRRAERGG